MQHRPITQPGPATIRPNPVTEHRGLEPTDHHSFDGPRKRETKNEDDVRCTNRHQRCSEKRRRGKPPQLSKHGGSKPLRP